MIGYRTEPEGTVATLNSLSDGAVIRYANKAELAKALNAIGDIPIQLFTNQVIVTPRVVITDDDG